MSEYKILEEHRKQSEETPNYDRLKKELRKYIIGGAAAYIPDLCEALKQDWYPRVPYEEITATPYLRNEIKNHVLNDWCTERSEDGNGWSRVTIQYFWPDWAAQPNMERNANEEKAYQAYRFFMRAVLKKKKDITNLYSRFPEPPAEPEDEEEETEAMPHRERPDSPEDIYRESMNHIGGLFESLFKYKHIPGPDTDLESKIIGPTEKYHLRLLKGLEEKERAALISVVSQLNIVSIAFLKRARDVLAEEPRIDK